MSEFAASRDAFQSRYVDAGGVKTHYLEAGEGPPVVLIHGGGAGADSLSNWYRCLPLMAKKFRVLAVDLVGFGKTDKPDPAGFTYSQEARNDHMVAFIEALRLRDVNLVGNSMGGATSIGVCVKRPDLVNRLVLMGSAGLNAQIREALLPLVNYSFTRDGMVKVCRTLAHDGFELDEDVVTYRYELSVEPQTKLGYQATMGWVKQQGGLSYPEEFIAKVARPALVVNGKDDLVVPLENAYRMLELIPESWGYIIPRCGHWAMLEHPEDFALETMKFLRA